MKWKPTGSVAWQMVGPEAVLVDVRSGATLGLNETGSFIWRRLGSDDDAQIADALAAEYRIAKDDADCDLAEFLELLVQRGFVQPA